MTYRPAPVVTEAERLMAEVESAVGAMPRKHRYTLGQSLRTLALESTISAHDAWRAVRAPQQQMHHLGKLIAHNDRLKLYLQTGHRLQAFTSRGRFESLAVIASNVGRQAGAWQRRLQQQHLNGQNLAAMALPERPESLSTRAAPTGANA